MSGLLRKICIFIVFGCFATSVAHSATVYTTTLNPTGGTANPDYLTKICKMYGVGGARPDSNGVCSTNDSDYVNPFNLSSSPINEFPQKYANHVDATDGYETFLGYMPSTVVPRIDNTGNYVGLTNSSGNGAMYAWWGGVTGVTPFTVNYYDGNTLVGTQSCTFGDSTGCDVLSPVGLLTAPTGKYFDGWRCASGTGYNCRANRYLPPDYANLSTPITPYGTSPISNWPNISATRYRDDLRDANGDVVTNMSYEYTGTSVINLYAAWAPYNVTFQCDPRTNSPYVGASTRTQSTYLDANGIIHDIVYGSVIPLDKNFGGASANPLCKSVYYKYDNDNGNDQWCSQYLDNAAGINSSGSTITGFGEVGGAGGSNYPYTYLGSKNVELDGSCSKYTLNYSCGSFNGETVPGVPPNQRKSLTNNGYISTNVSYGSQNMYIDRRKYPAPAYPYPQTNDGVCETYTLTPTSGANAGVPQEFGSVQIGTATNPGYGCCEKPQYAEFKGYQVRRTGDEILNNGELIQPGQYGASNCSVSFNNDTNPDTWQPGCDLWPWKGTVLLEAIWEHTPIQITFNHNNADNAANLLSTAYLKYGEGFYLYSISSGYSGQIMQMLPLPQKTGYTFGGYQYCDANDNCTMVVDSQGYFISGENNLKFTDVDITVSAVWDQTYTATYSCGTGTTGTAPTSDTVIYGTTPTLPSTAGSCAKAGYTLSGWRVDGESTDWVNGTSVWNFASDKNLTAQWELMSTTCSAGYYLAAGDTTCSECIAGNYCPGGTFNYNTTNYTRDQGINICTGATYSGAGAAVCTDCPTGYTYNTTPGKTSVNQCQIHCDAGTWVGYTRLEYIRSTGTQYIDTGVMVESPTSIAGSTIDFKVDQLETGSGSNTDTAIIAGAVRSDISNQKYTNFAAMVWQNAFFVNGGFSFSQTSDVYARTIATATGNGPASPYVNLVLFGRNIRDISGSWIQMLGTVSIYGATIYHDNVLVRDFVPARRHSDNVLGLYDIVTGTFYTNDGEGTFTAGPDVGIQCENVGLGYWSAASTLNYGQTGTRNACPAGTYSNINNGASASACIACTGATYSDVPAAASCTECPTNYTYNTTSGKTDATQCQIHCNAGTWVPNIPEYTAVEYLQSTGTQYIITDYVANPNTKVYMDYQLTDTAGQQFLFGQWGDSTHLCFVAYVNGTAASGGKWAECSYDNATGHGSSTVVNTSRHQLTLSAANHVESWTGVTFGSTSYTSTQTGASPIGIFANGTGNRFSKMRLYSFKIWENDVLLHDFIPARRNSDGEPGLYDAVTKEFLTNAGTGTFYIGQTQSTEFFGQPICKNVGTGHWSAESVVNWGSTGTRTACPAGTYSDIDNGASASACITCTGATYSGAGAASCTACPTGYVYNTTSGKTSVNQCQVQCDAGTYVPDGYTQLEYIHFDGEPDVGPYISTDLSMYTNVRSQNIRLFADAVLYSGDEGYEAIFGTSCNSGAYVGTRFDKAYVCGQGYGAEPVDLSTVYNKRCEYDLNVPAKTFKIYDTTTSTYIANVSGLNPTAGSVAIPISLGSFASNNSNGVVTYQRTAMDLYGAKIYNSGTLIFDAVPMRRNSDGAIGLYDKISNTFKTNASGTNPLVAGPGVAQTPCENVGFGYWAAASTVNFGSIGVRNACPVGTTTSTETAASESACAIDSKFTIVTTNMTANDTFKFHICSIGNFVVDWGDGSTLEVVAQNGTSPRGYTHTYTDAGVHRIRVGGIATQYDANTTVGIKNPAIFFYNQNAHNGTPTKIASIEGSIGAVFPTLGNELNQIPIFYRTFDGATNMTTIPSTLFSGATGARSDMFGSAFKGCSKLTTIPSGLFSGISGAGQRMFADTFNGCSSINAIPSGLFSGVNGSAANMFDGTFEGCSGITAIPSGLFDGVTGYAESMFIDTFYNCSKLTTIPSGLFRNVSGGATSMFQYTFGFCPKLEAIPSGLFDSVTTAADSMFAATFYGDTAIQQIPSGLFRNLSGGASSMFWATFAGCTGLTGPIPANLFSGITTAAQNQFYATFWGATNLSGYVPATLFSGLNGATATGMMDFVFLDTNLYEECPCGTHQYITGYEDDWSNKVSCEVGVKPNEVWYNNQCTTLCQSGVTHLKTSNGINVALLTDKLTSPALNVKYNDAICYVPLESNVGNGAINIKVGNTNYHTVAASQTPPANFGL